MKNSAGAQPSSLETQVLSVLWTQGPRTAREVLSSLPDGKARAYTTVLSTMQVMERKGLLKRVPPPAGTPPNSGGPIVFAPALTRREVLGPALRRLVPNAFGGRPSMVLQHLLSETPIDPDELAEIRRVLDEHAPATTKGRKPR
jgi:BlaI family transcriptional regulator, penicillinase repressor